MLIREAMDRLIEERPLYSDGKLVVTSLAAEAQVKRWILTHKHSDLQDEFRARITASTRGPADDDPREAETTALRAKLAAAVVEVTAERETVKRLERVVHVLTLENLQLKAAAEGASDVRHMPRRGY